MLFLRRVLITNIVRFFLPRELGRVACAKLLRLYSYAMHNNTVFLTKLCVALGTFVLKAISVCRRVCAKDSYLQSYVC
jgi:hypothetical protein